MDPLLSARSRQAKGGFNFDLASRNEFLIEKVGLKQPTATKTGTTIVGCLYKDGVVLGADTRATNDAIVADKNCEKIHYIADNIYCCGAGTAADTENTTNMISSQLELHRLATGRQPRVATAMTRLKRHLFRYQGHVSAALVLGGVDIDGPHIYMIYPHGSTDSLPFVTMGSGSLAAMAVFEEKYKANMTKEEAIDLVKNAICAGIFNDLGSGSNVDVCIITQGSPVTVEYLRNYEIYDRRLYSRNLRPHDCARGTTAVLTTTRRALGPMEEIRTDKWSGKEEDERPGKAESSTPSTGAAMATN